MGHLQPTAFTFHSISDAFSVSPIGVIYMSSHLEKNGIKRDFQLYISLFNLTRCDIVVRFDGNFEFFFL